jgi:hypothetical protein
MYDLVGGDSEPDAVAALELMTRALVGLTLQSLQVLDGEVSVPQFRLLLVLSGLGRVPSSRLASELGMTGWKRPACLPVVPTRVAARS